MDSGLRQNGWGAGGLRLRLKPPVQKEEQATPRLVLPRFARNGANLVLASRSSDAEIFADDFHGAVIAAHTAGFAAGGMFSVDLAGIIRS